jgi:glycosyltransferase involved in cell wall biosynthesis
MAVASHDPRKNFNRLVEAFKQVQDENLNLLLIGGQNKNFAIAESHLNETTDNRIIRLGYISDNQLAALYKEADAFIYPSFYEGFGLPNIEAMHFGCPVITSDIASCREVCGEAAVYVDPNSIQEIADAIRQIRTNSQFKIQMASLGKIQSSKYSWEKSAQQLSLLINKILKNT